MLLAAGNGGILVYRLGNLLLRNFIFLSMNFFPLNLELYLFQWEAW